MCYFDHVMLKQDENDNNNNNLNKTTKFMSHVLEAILATQNLKTAKSLFYSSLILASLQIQAHETTFETTCKTSCAVTSRLYRLLTRVYYLAKIVFL